MQYRYFTLDLNKTNMPKNKDFLLRIEIIDSCLRNHLRKWTLDGLVETVNYKLEDRYGKTTSKRTIQNDIRFLIEHKNAPIKKKKDGGVTYFFYADQQFSLKNLPINEEELERLKDAINILKQVTDFEIVDEVSAIISKLENTYDVYHEKTKPIVQFETHTIANGTNYISDLYEAIKGKTVLNVMYKKFTASESRQHMLHPYLLKEYRNRWFLVGRLDNTVHLVMLALDRMQRIQCCSLPFIENDLFDPEIYFNNIIGVTVPQGMPVEEIVLKVSASQAPYILTKPIHQTQKVLRAYKNGDLLIRLQLMNNYELCSVLLGYGADIEIIAPSTLRNTFKKIFEAALKKY